MTSTELTTAKDNLPAQEQDWFSEVPRSGRAPLLAGYATLFFGVFGFGAWAGTAPIDGAVVASGVFVATSQNKIVQHLEGGIIDQILIKEGQIVEEGQTLVRLKNTNALADLKRLKIRQAQLRAMDARLRSEAKGFQDLVSYPKDIAATDLAPDVRAIMRTQNEIYKARREKLENEVAIHKQTIAAYKQRIKGNEAELNSVSQQRKIVEEELKGKQQLLKAGLVRKPEYFALKRAHANMTGEIGRRTFDVADTKERIAGTLAQIERVKNIAVQTAVEERLTIEGELKDIRERITSAESVLKRIEIKAPVRGIVVKLHYHTAGGVIGPGNSILALLPMGDELVIEARIRPEDIDIVSTGQLANVRLTALSQRVTPMVPGSVVYVSADALPNDTTRLSDDNVYVARVQLDAEEAAKIQNFLPTPGMPSEVYIKTGERTFFQYLMQPVFDSFTRAFREA